MENEKYNILLVDDDVDLCVLLGEFLEGDGFIVDMFYSGDKVVDILLNINKYDMVVLDIMMFGMLGLDVLWIVCVKK